MGIHIDFQYIHKDVNTPSQSEITGWVKSALNNLRNNAELTVRIVDEEEITELNERWRKAEGSTNILSFPATDTEKFAPDLLGDIVICGPVVEREAQQQKKPVTEHWAHMVVHGVLHLLGYDHVEEQEADIMESMEIHILKDLGINNPYI